jgi:hypothetical protein
MRFTGILLQKKIAKIRIFLSTFALSETAL